MAGIEVPQWLTKKVGEYAEIMGFGEWDIFLDIQLVVDSDESCLACCHTQPNINAATITFRADIEDNPRWHVVIIHELLHVAHGRIDHFMWDSIMPHLAEPTRVMGFSVYDSFMEPYIATWSKILYRLIEGKDTPSLHDGDGEEYVNGKTHADTE